VTARARSADFRLRARANGLRLARHRKAWTLSGGQAVGRYRNLTEVEVALAMNERGVFIPKLRVAGEAEGQRRASVPLGGFFAP